MSELENMDPEFFEAGRQNPFTVPQGYFESLPTRVQNYCQEKDVLNEKPNWLLALKSQLALAGGFLLLVLLGYTGYYYGTTINQLNLNAEPDYIKIVEKQITEFDEVELYDAILNGSKPKKDSLVKPYDDEIIHYLLRENLDNVTLIEHSKDIKP